MSEVLTREKLAAELAKTGWTLIYFNAGVSGEERYRASKPYGSAQKVIVAPSQDALVRKCASWDEEAARRPAPRPIIVRQGGVQAEPERKPEPEQVLSPVNPTTPAEARQLGEHLYRQAIELMTDRS